MMGYGRTTFYNRSPAGRHAAPRLEVRPGTEAEVPVLDTGSREGDNPSLLTNALAADTLKQLWDSPEEDEWRALQQEDCSH
jgi:hypothetical protein